MKTSVSIPDALFMAAEREAKRLSVSRSQLYANAIREFLKSRSSEEITRRLNEVYSEQPSEIDSALMALQMQAIRESAW